MTPASQYTFQQFNDEINEFYKYLKSNKYTDEEICKIFAPLRPDAGKIKLTTIIICSSFFILATLYFATYIETISWRFAAIGRILLIKLLPFWDWTSLKNAKCLVEKTPSATAQPEIPFNCYSCEGISAIDVYSDISGDFLQRRYLDTDVPVIVGTSWAKPARIEDFLENLLDNREIAASKPCSLSTNICNGLPTVKSLLRKTSLFDSFFLHFQNCNLPAMKQFRGFAPRPQFLPPELSPVQYNWLLWSKNYNISHFKPIELVERVAVLGQILGANLLRLIPRGDCESECPVVEVKLKEGESIVFTSLWNLEYRPEPDENLAVILEVHY